LGLLDRLLGKDKHKAAPPKEVPKAAPAPDDDADAQDFKLPDRPFVEPRPTPVKDRTSEWVPQRETGPRGTIKPLTESVPVAYDDEAVLESPKPESQEPRVVEPVSEERIDELHTKAMQGHSAKDLESLWDAILSKPELHILQRGRANQVEAHVVESPLGPMLLAFTSRFRVQVLTSTKAFHNTPFVWSVSTLPMETALDWIIEQRRAGVQAVEVNRSAQPGAATILQSLPARFERVHGHRLTNADLVAPNFEGLANLIRIDLSPANLDSVHEKFFGLQRWYAIRDPKRPHQPAFVPVQEKPALMLFTSESEALAGAKAVGRGGEGTKLLMTIEPAKLVKWMATLPGQGAPAAIVNGASAPFMIDLAQIDAYWQRFGGSSASD